MIQQPYSVSFYTLGCRLNQVETAHLCEIFRQQGYTIKAFGEHTDICIINTCSVTGQSEARCRNMVRGVLRKHPQTFMIVVGCYAQVGLDVLRTIPGIDMIVGTDRKYQVLDYLTPLFQKENGLQILLKQPAPLIFHSTDIAEEDFTIEAVGHFVKHTRANIKIQDGCNFFCSYCIVPYTRGRDRSRVFDDIRKEALQLIERGHQEIVITGVNIGTYSSQGHDFLDILKMLEDLEGVQRIRITSIEPMTIPEGITEYIASSRKLCHFFHIPLQSGDNQILQQMNRRYTREEFSAFVTTLADSVPDINIGTDIIVGFPGEGEQEFEHSRQLLEELPINYAHVFSFSPREGTPAATMDGRVPSETIKQRSQILRTLSQQKRRVFYERYVGKTVTVLFEQQERNGLFTGYTDNYMKVGVSTEATLSNSFRRVTITSVNDAAIAVGHLQTDPQTPEETKT
ncbi:tRNA (N(6)-L-threonylcarbamoyladenosine(37)-C(2))-methylthiotransferase MtaB [candidate division KSB3 bacterium]|uniref:tRNA (N(6)-L-threonylcarbamoyladenosine(37)-C(2))-methylthiotransferase n=1 Tax=candidate division KSB3 bacterium TaxID=2044937 RepID=A0A2G6KIJ1_9BACT|nr:MAG: tRNA (N(6)-L-threonylcarbamoyladenosine(37)-C(2))-methylthiotransferase MtaB [candidate division KSB3 bacterium]